MRSSPSVLLFVALGGLVVAGACREGTADPPPDEATTPAVDTADPWAVDGCSLRWERDVVGFFDNWCAPCHSAVIPEGARQGAPVGVDLETLDNVRIWAERVRATALGDEGSMPPAGGPSAAEKALVEAWIDCDMPGEEVLPVAPCDDPVPVPVGDARTACATASAVVLEGDLVVDEELVLDCVCAITGDLSLQAPLASVQLQAIGGRLEVTAGGEALATPALRSVGGDLEVHSLSVASVTVDGLETVGGPLFVHDTGALQHLSLDRLRTLGGPMTVQDAPALATVDWPRLATVPGDIVFARLPALTSLESLVSVRVLPGALVVESTGVTHLDDMRGFEAIEGGLRIESNADLVSIDGFWHLAELPSLRVNDAPSLRGLSGFDVLPHVGALEVRGVPQLELLSLGALETLGSLGVIDEGLLVADADRLASVDLPLARVVARLYVARTGITSLDGLAAVQTIGPVTLVDNDALVEVTEPSRSVQVGGLELDGNDALASVTAFAATQTMLGPVVVQASPALTVLDLSSLSDVHGELRLDDLPLLGSLGPLAAVRDIDGPLTLRGLAVQALAPLHGVERVGGDLVVTGNLLLPESEVLALVAAVGDIEGAVVAYDNGKGTK